MRIPTSTDLENQLRHPLRAFTIVCAMSTIKNVNARVIKPVAVVGEMNTVLNDVAAKFVNKGCLNRKFLMLPGSRCRVKMPEHTMTTDNMNPVSKMPPTEREASAVAMNSVPHRTVRRAGKVFMISPKLKFAA